MADNTFNIVGNLLLKVDGAEAGLNKLKNSLSQLKMPANLDSSLKKSFSNLDGLFAKYKAQLKDGFNTKGDVTSFAKTGRQIEAEYDKISATISKLTGKEISFKADLTAIHNTEKELERLITLKEKLSQNIKGGLGLSDYLQAMQASDVGRKGTKVFDASNILQTSLGRGDIEKAKADVESLISELNRMSDVRKKALESRTGLSMVEIIDKIKNSVNDADTALNKYNVDIKKASDETARLESGQFERANQAISDAVNSADKLTSGFKEINGGAQQAADSMFSMTKQVEQLQQSTQYFFSLRNMINLLKRGIDDAVQSVKELDKAMTETAVVTDYKVSDLWGMLPEYTKVANELGATTQGAYETMTLYYQQGLDQQQAFELGAETMKMARIAGLDYAETTDMMTAALRGFNMELNETSAKRVNDVYSELAAITASDTEELGTAMQRTASIAASAGASFEGTTAFLAQAIETTREPAENIGTAMKTIVARFQEMKKNPLEISEVDGEEVDYNKIDAALKTIGVDLKDTNGQFRDFDQVMLDISAKWDTLSQSQQRYIATTAAGSRQQSRFIAMVSNYDRTMQLMEAANNSAGASDEQFEKTMDSLESKLNQLHNAWQAFTMGIANNGMIKLAVDGLTNFLTVTNKIIDTLSMGSGAIKSFLSVFAAFTGLKAAGRIANRAIGGLGGLIDPQSTFKEGFRGGAIRQGQNQAQAKAISTPIVNSLSKISGQIAAIAKAQGVKDAGQKGQSTAGTKETSKEDYKQIKQAFDKLSGKDGFKMGDASNLFKQLDEKHQYSMFKNSPGTKAAMKQASLNWIDSKGWSEEFTKEGKNYVDSIYKGMEQGKIPVSKGISLIGQPAAWGKVFGTDVAKNISSSYIDGLKTSTNQAHQEAIKYLVPNPEQAGVDSDYFKQWFASARDEQKKAYLDKFRTEKEKLDGGLGGATGTVSNMGRFANDIGAVADRFTQAGYGISAFGSLLSQLGGPIGTVGAGIQSLGGIVSSVGMSISGATGLITMFTEGVEIAGTGITIMGSTIAAVVGPIAALGAALFIAHQHFKKIKEAGEEVTNTFKESSKSVEDNIAKLKSYQSEFATLSKGVDSSGNNVNLDDSQYQRYLEIVDDIAAINPDIIEGYNAQGHAIINNNTALAETLKLQEQIKNKTYETYTSEASLQKLINARNINKDYKNIQTQENGVSMGYGHGNEGRNASNGIGKAVPLAGDVSSIADKLRLVTGTDALGNTIKVDDKMLQKYGIESMDALISGEEQAVKKFIKHRDQIQADLANSGIELNEGILKGFEKLGENSAAFDAAIQPVYDNLLANVSNSKVFESIAPEFRDALNMGLKDLASQDLSASEMSKAANNMATRFANLTTGSGKYKDALDIVEKAQQDFAASLNETEYKADVQPAIDDLTRLKEKALSEGSAYGDALAEYLENQIEQISRFTEEGTVSLSEALNTMQDDIAAAEGALSSFQEATKSDYSTAASGMKGIFEEIFKETDGIQLHTEGFGDQTFWKGAKELLSEDVVDTGNIDNVIDKLNKIKPALEDGQDGWENFLDIVENTKGMDKWFKFFDDGTYDINIPEEEFSEVAKQLGVSENFLTSMLNKGRQFANISFSNVDSVRKALATSDSAIKGKTVDANGNKNLYVKEDSIRAELFNQGYVTKEDQDRQLAAYFEKGIKTIPAADSKELTADQLKSFANDWGVKNLPDLIQTLNETGEFTKDEIKAYADKLGMLDTEEGFEQDYAHIISAAENPELVRQTSELQSINAKVGALLDKRNPEEQTSAWQDFHKMIYGGEGVDTDFQQFARGKNSSGGSLDSGEYETTKKNMQEAIQTAEEASQKYKFMAEQSSGADKTHFEELAQKYDADAQHIKALMTAGEKAYSDSQKQIDKERQAAQSRNANRTESQKQQQQAANQAQAKTNAQAANEKGKTQTNTIINNTEENKTVHEKTIYEAEVDPQLEDLNAKYGYDRTTQTIVNYLTKGEEDLQLAEDKISNIDLATQDPKQIMITANTNGISVAEAALKSLPSTKTIGLNLNTGGFTAKISDVLGKLSAVAAKAREAKLGGTAAGHNNSFKTIPVPMFQSAAKGKGHVGPKNRGGLTLTGEEGYEIAWLPSEGKSMILGAAGPQMINLPADAVVYTHEQSEDILKKKQTIDAGSHAGTATGTGTRRNRGGSTSSSRSRTSTKSNKGKKGKKSKKGSQNKDKKKSEVPKIINYSIEETIRFNLDASLEKLGYEIDKRTKTIEKSLSKIGTTSKDIAGNVQTQLSALKAQKDTNQALLDSYKRQSNEIFNWQETVSYQDWITKTETTGKGKKKKTTTTTELGSLDTIINLRDYMIQQADGSYQANENAIRAIANVSLQKSVQEAVSNAVSSINSGMIKAQQAIDEANEKMEELGQQVSEAFFQWENELTQVYNLTQRINEEISLTDRFSSQVSLELSKLNAGFGTTADAIDNIRKTLVRNNETLERQLQDQKQLITARRLELEDAMSSTDEEALLKEYQAKTDWISPEVQKATLEYQQQQVDGAKIAAKYVTELYKDLDGSIRYEVDWEQIEADRQAGNLKAVDYEVVKKKIDELNSAATDYNNSIKDTTDLVAEQYKQFREYQETIADFEDILISGLEDIKENELDALKNISDAVSDTLSDLLDEVKRRLDERRQREDNLKTEQDISKKQQRLAALRANTAGGNQVAIRQLEQEIADAQQSYQKTLEDQLLDKLQQQGDEAARQRERQIELLEYQLEADANRYQEEVNRWLNDPEKYKQEIFEVWKKANDYDSKGEIGQQLLAQTFDSSFTELITAVEQTGFTDYFSTVQTDLQTLIGIIQNSKFFKEAEVSPTNQNVNSASTIEKNLSGAIKAREAGNSVKQLQELGFKEADIIGAGYTVSELREGGYNADTLLKYNKTSRDLKEGGFTAKELKDAGINLRTLFGLNYGATELKNAGFGISDLQPYFDVASLQEAGFTNAADYKKANYQYSDLQKYFTNEQLANVGYTEAIDAINKQKELEQQKKEQEYNTLLERFNQSGFYSEFRVGELLQAGKAINKNAEQIGEEVGIKGISYDRFTGNTKLHHSTYFEHLGLDYSDITQFYRGVDNGYKSYLSKLEEENWKRAIRYATGGLNTTTGPAWLDGTPSKPELVLNSTDTKNFLALKDVLSKVMGSTQSINNSYGGDNIFEININVDKIEKDYDVDRVADRVKKKILESSSYRNVTQVRNFR